MTGANTVSFQTMETTQRNNLILVSNYRFLGYYKKALVSTYIKHFSHFSKWGPMYGKYINFCTGLDNSGNQNTQWQLIHLDLCSVYCVSDRSQRTGRVLHLTAARRCQGRSQWRFVVSELPAGQRTQFHVSLGSNSVRQWNAQAVYFCRRVASRWALYITCSV